MDTQNTVNSPFSALEQWEPDSRPTTLDRPRSDDQPVWGADGFTFDDVLDMVNPLQHIPVASKTYQEITGDTASEGAKLVGGAVFGALTGGILGLVTALFNAAVRHDTGKDLPEHALALLTDESANEVADAAVSKEKKSDKEFSIPREQNASGSFTESLGDSQHAVQTNFFADDEAARSLHPAERLLAISRHFNGETDASSRDDTQQKSEPGQESSMRHKVSETYGKATEDTPTQHLGEV